MILDLEEVLTSREIKLLHDFEGFYVDMETSIIEKLLKMSIDEIKEIICALKAINEDCDCWLNSKSVKELILDYAESMLKYKTYEEKEGDGG